MKSSPPTITTTREKPAQQRRPSAAKNKEINKIFLKMKEPEKFCFW